MSTENDSAKANPADTRAMSLHQSIADRARYIWKQNGAPNGRDEEFWLQAEREVLGTDTSIRLEQGHAVLAPDFETATDANGAKAKSGAE